MRPFYTPQPVAAHLQGLAAPGGSVLAAALQGFVAS